MGYRRTNDIFTNYDAALEYVRRARDRYAGRPVGNNTRLIERIGRDVPNAQRPHGVALMLHGTDVVTLYADGSTEFDTGGWDTVTTADRMRWNNAFEVYLYVPRGFGDTERYSYVRPRAPEDALRRKYDLPNLGEELHLSEYSFKKFVGWDGARGAGYEVTDPEALERFREYEQEAARTLPAWILVRSLLFSRTGKCLTDGARKLDTVLAQERRARERVIRQKRSAMSISYKAIRRLRRGMRLPECDGCGERTFGPDHLLGHVNRRTISGELVIRCVERSLRSRNKDPRDWRYWLNFHFNDNNDPMLGGRNLPRVVEPHIRRAVYGTLCEVVASC